MGCAKYVEGKVTAGVMAVACGRRRDGSGLVLLLTLMEQVREREREKRSNVLATERVVGSGDV